MNIQVQCCGIVLLLFFLYFYSRQKNLHLNTGTAFFRTLIATLVSITMDALSIIAICNGEKLPPLFVKLVCKTYLATLILPVFCAVYYICTDIYTRRVEYRRVLYCNAAIGLVGIPLIYLLPISIHCDMAGREVYTYGPSVLAAYASASIYFVINWVLLLRKKNVIRKSRRASMQFWMLVWIGAAIIQFFHNELLLVGYASAIGIMVLYLKLENPEMNLDKETGLFHQMALTRYLKQLSNREKHVSILLMVFEHSFYQNSSQESETVAEMEMINFISGVPGTMAFRSAGDEILLLYEDRAEAEKGLGILRRRFECGWGKDGQVFRHPFWIYLPDSAMLQDVKDVFLLIRHARQNSKELVDNGFLQIGGEFIQEMYRTREIEWLIFNAIGQDRIMVYYQPIYSTAEKRFTSAEALVRITDESGRMVPPNDFIRAAEKNGMMLRLGEIIFEKVCRFIKESNPAQYGLQYIEVNLSAVQCAYAPLADTYIAIMERYGISPQFINLEITETAALGTKKVVLDNMNRLIDYGVSFSLDDFGTGQSNLNYIVDMPVSIVKFDRSMTNSYFENGKAKYVMDAAMHMIQGMQLKIVSEGIETREQCEIMEALGINYIQGYHFSKPLEEQAFLAFIRGRNA